MKFRNDPKYEEFVLNSSSFFFCFVFQAKAKAAHDRLLRLNYNGQRATLVSQSSDDIYIWSSVLYLRDKWVRDFIKEVCFVVLCYFYVKDWFWCIFKFLCIYLFFPSFLALKSLLVTSVLVLSFNWEPFSIQMFCQKFQNIEDILRLKIRGDIFWHFFDCAQIGCSCKIF